MAIILDTKKLISVAPSGGGSCTGGGSSGGGGTSGGDQTAFVPHLTGCTLTQSAEGGSTLSLEFAGTPPDWVKYWQQVTLRHEGMDLFTGQITSISTSNVGGAVRSYVTVRDYWFLLERQTSAQQLTDLLNQSRSEFRFKDSAAYQTESWAAMARAVRLSAPGWTTAGGSVTTSHSS